MRSVNSPVALLRSRRPGWALGLSMLALVPLQLVLPIYQTIPIPSMVAGYSYAVVADRRRAVLAASLVVTLAACVRPVRMRHDTKRVVRKDGDYTLVAADGTAASLDQLQDAWTPPSSVVDDGDVELLGPVELPAGVRRPAGLGDTEAELARRLIIRVPAGHEEEVGASLRAALSLRATRRQNDPLRVVVDPVRVG